MRPRHRKFVPPALVLAAFLGLLPAPVCRAAGGSVESEIRRAEGLFREGRGDRALALLDSLSHRVRDSRDPRLAPTAAILQAEIHSLRGRPREAEPHARRAASLAAARGDSAQLSRALRWLAASLATQGRGAEAEVRWKRLLAIAVARGDAEHEGFARLGLAYQDAGNGRTAPARDGYRSAAALFRKSGRVYWEAWALTALGRLEHATGNLRAARECHAEAAEVSRRGGVREYEAHARNNIAALDYLQGDPGRALEGFRAARRIQREIGQHHGAVIASHNEAIALRDLGRFEDASALLDSALSEARSRGHADLEAELLIELGELRRVQGRLGESARLLRRALAAGEAMAPQDRMEAALSLAATLEARDSAAAGIAQLEGLARPLWPRLPVETRAEADHVAGRWLLDSGRPREALDRLRRADESAAGAGIGRFRIGPLTSMADGERRLGDWGRARECLDRAASVWEAERAHVDDPEWRERYGTLVRELMFERARFPLEDPAGGTVESRAVAAFEAVQPFKSRTLRERMLGPEGTTAGRAAPAAMYADSLRDILGDGDLYLECIEGADGIVLLALSRDASRGVVLDSSGPRLRERLARLGRLLAGPPRRPGDGGEERAVSLAAGEIGRELLGPVADLIAGARRVIVSPDGILCRVPLACLGSPDGGAGGPLIDRVEVAWVPSATVLHSLRRRPPDAAGGRLLAIEGAAVSGQRLPGARAEARWLARSFAGAEARPGGGPNRQTDLAPYAVLHFASHGEVDDQHPWRSGMLMSPTGDAGGDGWLRASEIALSRIQARLVVLASCRSAGGPVISGEGVIGLTGAFLSAGAPAVVATLWPVDDRVTERLMKRFYRGIARGLTVSTALREAQRSLREDPRTRHPFYWAGFVLVGDPDVVVPLRGRSGLDTPGMFFAGLAAVIAALTAGGLVRARRRAAKSVTEESGTSLTP